MNKENLSYIFNRYIDHFEFLNNEKNDESYKWEIAQEFQSFDVEAEDFAGMLSHYLKLSDNFIDNSQQLPFTALVEYARREPETVREMFRKLYAEEHLDNTEKQKSITEFISETERLRNKYFPNSRLYINNQRSVMMYLFLRYPESNYGYKASQAKSFADCIGFYDDWGPMSDFKLDVFSRMCDLLIDEIKQNDALLETHRSRYEHTNRLFHPDSNLHILAHDIIYTSQAYNFYGEMVFDSITASSRKLYFERVSEAKKRAAAVEAAEAEKALLTEAKKYIAQALMPGMTIKHRIYGAGTILNCDGSVLAVRFKQTNEEKRLGLQVSLTNKLISFESEETMVRLNNYLPVLRREMQIDANLSRAVNVLQPYLEYLE